MKEYKINTTFRIEKLGIVRCVESNASTGSKDCIHCCMKDTEELCNEVYCSDVFRKDLKNVYFVLRNKE